MKTDGIGEEYTIYGILFSLSNRIQAIGDKEFKDIPMKQHFMMIALGKFMQAPTLREMAEFMGCSYQNVKRMAENLQKEGYLNIVLHSQDRRKLLLESTGKFEQFEDETSNKSSEFMAGLFKDISDEDLSVTLKTMMKMEKNIEKNQ